MFDPAPTQPIDVWTGLARIGIKSDSVGEVRLADRERAESGYIHHSTVPVAVAAFSLVSPQLAKRRFPRLRLEDFIAKRPAMDQDEASMLAAVCGLPDRGPFWGNARPFAEHLFDVLDRYEMQCFFEVRPDLALPNSPQYAVRPRGAEGAGEAKDDAVAQWRRPYRRLTPERQMMVATVMWLYRARDRAWLSRVPKAWHAADAITALREAGVLIDWARLVVRYPGW